MMHFDEDENRLAKLLFVLSALLLVAFTVFDILNIFPLISDSLKLSGIVLCFLYTVMLLFTYGAELDRVMLMLSMLFAIAADVFLLFTSQYLIGILLFCFVQEFQSVRLLSIRRSIVRMNGRISVSYRSYKTWRAVLLQNLFQLLLSAVLLAVSQLVPIKNAALLAAALFYGIGFLLNLIRVFSVSHDVRLLDDMRPLRFYAFGMLFYFICDLLLIVIQLPVYLPFLSGFAGYAGYVRLFVWPFYLSGMAMIAASGARRQKFYS